MLYEKTAVTNCRFFILKKTKNDKVKAAVLDILSRINLNEKKYQSAIKYAQQSEEIFSKNKIQKNIFIMGYDATKMHGISEMRLCGRTMRIPN